MRTAPLVILNDMERETLERWARSGRTPYRLVLRARIVLLAAEGKLNSEIARELRIAPMTAGRWRRRFIAHRVAGIEHDAPRNRRAPSKRDQLADLVMHKTLNERPPHGERWTTRSMAKAVGASHSTIKRIWDASGVRPQVDALPGTSPPHV